MGQRTGRALVSMLAVSMTLSAGAFVGFGEAASASGLAHLTFDDGALRTVSFDATRRRDNTVHGHVSIQDRTPIPSQDVDGTGDPELAESSSGLDLTARVECLVVEGRRAVVGGRITHADVGRYVGKYVFLFVEDKGREAARLNWGFYDAGAGVSCESFPGAALVEVTGGGVKVSP
ncbi:MAG: hypothetical protein ACREF4_06700 [Gammaproteobacteria bacterium]